MSDAPFTEKLVPAGTQDPAATAARQRLQAALAQLNPAGGVLDDGDGTGRHANKTKKTKKASKTTKPVEATPPASLQPPVSSLPPAPSPLQPVDATYAERAAKFDKLDKEKTGKLTREQYVSRQSDPEAAAKRFEKFDTNKDGVVTREEYITGGAKKLK